MSRQYPTVTVDIETFSTDPRVTVRELRDLGACSYHVDKVRSLRRRVGETLRLDCADHVQRARLDFVNLDWYANVSPRGAWLCAYHGVTAADRVHYTRSRAAHEAGLAAREASPPVPYIGRTVVDPDPWGALPGLIPFGGRPVALRSGWRDVAPFHGGRVVGRVGCLGEPESATAWLRDDACKAVSAPHAIGRLDGRAYRWITPEPANPETATPDVFAQAGEPDGVSYLAPPLAHIAREVSAAFPRARWTVRPVDRGTTLAAHTASGKPLVSLVSIADGGEREAFTLVVRSGKLAAIHYPGEMPTTPGA
jgi:hypothetical protein